jgi:anti-sigma B factor antagonist
VHRDDHLDSLTVSTAREFDVRSRFAPGGAHVVQVSGDLDLATAPLLDEALADVSGEMLVIDLSDCTFLDSAGIRALLGAARGRSEAPPVRIVTADPGMVRLFEITGVDKLMHVHPSVDAAL